MKKLTLMGLGACLMALGIQVPDSHSASSARVAWVTNTVQVTRGGRWVRAYSGIPVASGAYVRTGSGSRAQVHYSDGSVMRLGSSSVARVRYVGSKNVNLKRGKAYFKVQKQKKRMRVRTRTSVATVLGTEFLVEIKPITTISQAGQQGLSYGSVQLAQAGGAENFTTQITTLSGLVGVGDSNGGNMIEVGPGMTTFVGQNLPPTPPQQADQEQLRREGILQDDQVADGDPDSLANQPLDPGNPQQQVTIQQNSPGSQGNLDTSPTTGELEVIIR